MRQCLMLFLIFPMPDVLLSLQVPCVVNLEEGVEYHKISWYKVSISSGSLVGLIMKDLRTNTTQLYKFADHSYQIGNDLSLLHVPEHSQEECEMYRCCVWPPVGHQFLQNDSSLPQGCQRNAVIMAAIPSQLPSTDVVLPHNGLYIGGLVLVILVIAAVGYHCKHRTRHTRAHISI